MAGSSFGKILRLSTFGESHGEALGGVIDGFPAGFSIDFDALDLFVSKRKPGQSKLVTQRKEADSVEFLSGLFEGKTTGTPIAFIIRNKDAKSKDYSHNKDIYRPSHADATYDLKYGIRDYRGGGRSSARETVARVVAGGLSIQYLAKKGIKIQAFVDQVGAIRMPWKNQHDAKLAYSEEEIENSLVRCPETSYSDQMQTLIEKTKKNGDSIGGCIACKIINVPTGLGEPVFDKLPAILGQAMLSINAVKGIEFGEGFSASTMNGSDHNDVYNQDSQQISNFAAGTLGGISNGQPIYFRTAFKPVATIAIEQPTIDSSGTPTTIVGKGRHDACVVPRAVPIIEAMSALVLLDSYLLQNAYQ